jgi:hypothetical protein
MRMSLVAIAKSRTAAEVHMRAVLSAAMGMSLRMSAEVDGSKPFSEMVSTKTDTEVSKDVAYIREVSKDYENQQALDRNHRAEHWESVAYDLDQELTTVVETSQEIQAHVDEYHELFVRTFKDLELLGQKFL